MVGKIGVVGLGYVGLPLAAVLSDVGYTVVGLDIKSDMIERLNRKAMADFYEPGLDELLAKNRGRLSFTTDYTEMMASCDSVFITVGTPLNGNGAPDYSHLDSAMRSMGGHLRKGHLLVLKSTVMPGTTEDHFVPWLEERSGLKAGKDFSVAYCPERTVEGAAVHDLYTLPKMIGGIDEASTLRTEKILSRLGGKVIKVSSTRVAELGKICDNLSRAVNIALANEIGLICEEAGIDGYELVRAVNDSYERGNLYLPGLGADGPCLSKDPGIIRHYMKGKGLSTLVADACDAGNRFSTERIGAMVHEFVKGIDAPVIAFVGLAFKGFPETDDIRGSAAAKIHGYLKDKVRGEFRFCDPLVGEFLGKKVHNSLEACVEGANVVLFLTNHRKYMGVDVWQVLERAGRPLKIIDCWHNLVGLEGAKMPKGVEVFRVGDGSL